VTLGFSGHAHSYQRFSAPAGGIPTYATGGGGASVDPIGTLGCSPTHAYGVGWSNASGTGSACGSAPIPSAKDRVHHYLLVDVNGPNVTVTPVDELGRTFDPITYNVPPASADLSLTKSDTPDPALAGQLLTYTLTVHNDGPSTAIATQVTDDLPPGVTFVSATPSQGNCTETAGEVTCTIGALASGTGATVNVKVRPQAAGTIDNDASASSGVADPNTSNNSASAVTTVDPAADLSLQKSDSPDPVPVGQVLTYSLTAANDGPSPATGVQVVDSLSPDVTFESASSSQGTCSHASGNVMCSLGTLAAGGNATIQIQVRPQSSGSVVNQATISSPVADPGVQDNTATAETTVDPAAGLSLSQDDAPDPVLAGQPLAYTLTAHNAGPLAASGAELTDTLPAGVTYQSATPSQGTCSHSTGTVTCTLGTIGMVQAATVQIVVVPHSPGTITNQATLTSSTFDADLSDNSTSADTLVSPAADLSLQKSDSPDPALAGEPITYTLTAHNAGPSTATGVELTDTLPAGMEFDSAVASQGSCTEQLGTVTCTLGSLASGVDATIDIVVERNTTGSVTNQASISSTVADPNTSDNSASADTTITPAADLGLTKTGEPDPVLPGMTLTYALEIANTGPQSATGVEVTDTLPAGVTFESATPSQGTCTPASGIVTCALGTILSGQTGTVEIKLQPHGSGSVVNQASVTSDVADPHLQNNDASETTTLESTADLSLAKSDSPDPVRAGQLLTYGLTVQNAGPSAAAGVLLTDELPAGVAFDSVTSSQGTCLESSGTVDCTLGLIDSGVNATVEIKVRPQSEGSITNNASVSGSTYDPSTSNNSASADTTVTPAADLSLTKTDSPDPVTAGQALTYTLTAHNAGPSAVADVQLSDTLPSAVTYGSATPSQGSCTHTSGTVDCALGALSSGQDATVAIVVTTQSQGTLHNTASVSSSVFDPSASNNSAAAGTSVVTPNYVRPKGATPFRVPLVPAYQPCAAASRTHGPPLVHPSCTPAVPASSLLTVGTPDANGAAANGSGFVLFKVDVNADPTPSDVLMITTVNDVRCQSGVTTCGAANAGDGPDYVGQLQVLYDLRLTDRFNDPPAASPATGSDTTFPLTMPCSASSSTGSGATCTLNTTANSIMPGSARSGDRAVWEIGKVRVFDGGPDGVASTADNTPFQAQGVFIP
jgi:uncharacterized repeat protein (TIGR01451 family)